MWNAESVSLSGALLPPRSQFDIQCETETPRKERALPREELVGGSPSPSSLSAITLSVEIQIVIQCHPNTRPRDTTEFMLGNGLNNGFDSTWTTVGDDRVPLHWGEWRLPGTCSRVTGKKINPAYNGFASFPVVTARAVEISLAGQTATQSSTSSSGVAYCLVV